MLPRVEGRARTSPPIAHLQAYHTQQTTRKHSKSMAHVPILAHGAGHLSNRMAGLRYFQRFNERAWHGLVPSLLTRHMCVNCSALCDRSVGTAHESVLDVLTAAGQRNTSRACF